MPEGLEHRIAVFARKLIVGCLIAGWASYTAMGWYLDRGVAPIAHDEAPVAAPVASLSTHAVATAAVLFSTTTPKRMFETLAPEDAVPAEGKFITADLKAMKLTLYQDGVLVATYPIIAKGRPGTPDETPAGFYRVLGKEYSHFVKRSEVYMPYSLQFYGNYFIHGPPFFTNGQPLPGPYSGGCIRLSYEHSRAVFLFAGVGTGVYVYDPPATANLPSLALKTIPAPSVTAGGFVVADADTRDVYLESNAQEARPVSEVTKVMTALVAHETLTLKDSVVIPRGQLELPPSNAQPYEVFPVGDLLYPLLMQSNTAIADTLAEYYGTGNFVRWMNASAHALGMDATHFADPSGSSPDDVSTPDDLFRLAAYVGHKKSFLWGITRTKEKQLVATSGGTYRLENTNLFVDRDNFIGGQMGAPSSEAPAMLSLFTVPVHGISRRVVIAVVNSQDAFTDTSALLAWFTHAAEQGSGFSAAACASCATSATYRSVR